MQWFLACPQPQKWTHTSWIISHSAKPDTLSRCVNYQVEEEDNEDQVMLPTECFTSEPPDTLDKCLWAEKTGTEPTHVHIKTGSSGIMNQVCGCTDWDKSVVSTLKELGSGVDLQRNEWKECNGLILFRGKVYVPLDAQLWHDIMEAHHDTLVMDTWGSGRWLVAWNYWWLGMGCYITKYVKGCDLCNQTKMFPVALAPAGKLMPSCIPYCWWQIISVDLIMELPQSHSYDSILVMVD